MCWLPGCPHLVALGLMSMDEKRGSRTPWRLQVCELCRSLAAHCAASTMAASVDGHGAGGHLEGSSAAASVLTRECTCVQLHHVPQVAARTSPRGQGVPHPEMKPALRVCMYCPHVLLWPAHMCTCVPHVGHDPWERHCASRNPSP